MPPIPLWKCNFPNLSKRCHCETNTIHSSFQIVRLLFPLSQVVPMMPFHRIQSDLDSPKNKNNKTVNIAMSEDVNFNMFFHQNEFT